VKPDVVCHREDNGFFLGSSWQRFSCLEIPFSFYPPDSKTFDSIRTGQDHSTLVPRARRGLIPELRRARRGELGLVMTALRSSVSASARLTVCKVDARDESWTVG